MCHVGEIRNSMVKVRSSSFLGEVFSYNLKLSKQFYKANELPTWSLGEGFSGGTRGPNSGCRVHLPVNKFRSPG